MTRLAKLARMARVLRTPIWRELQLVLNGQTSAQYPRRRCDSRLSHRSPLGQLRNEAHWAWRHGCC